jgi:hypothetical protein
MASSVLAGAGAGAATGSVAGPWGAAIGGLVGGGVALLGDRSAKKQANAKAAALQLQANRRLKQGKDQSAAIIAEGGATQTSEFASMLGRGVSRNASIVNQSLDEIANRAEFASNQALESARLDAESIQQDRASIYADMNDSINARNISSFGSILGSGMSMYSTRAQNRDAMSIRNEERAYQENLYNKRLGK